MSNTLGAIYNCMWIRLRNELRDTIHDNVDWVIRWSIDIRIGIHSKVNNTICRNL